MVRRFLGSVPLLAIPVAPLLIFQGRRVRRETPRLPAAAGPQAGQTGGPGSALRLLVIGESTAAGVGATTHEAALAGQLAQALARDGRRKVSWEAAGWIGATAGEVSEAVRTSMASRPVDCVVLVFGVNDVLALHDAARWSQDLAGLIDLVQEKFAAGLTVLAGVPPMGRCPAFPQPLRAVLGWRARLLDATAGKLAHGRADVIHVATPALAQVDDGLFCRDRFHPSERGYAVWAAHLAAGIAPLIGSGRREFHSESAARFPP